MDEECLSSIGAMSVSGHELRPPMYVQRLMLTLRTVLLMVRDLLKSCHPDIDQVDGHIDGPTGDPLQDIVEDLLHALDEEFTGDVLRDIELV